MALQQHLKKKEPRKNCDFFFKSDVLIQKFLCYFFLKVFQKKVESENRQDVKDVRYLLQMVSAFKFRGLGKDDDDDDFN